MLRFAAFNGATGEKFKNKTVSKLLFSGIQLFSNNFNDVRVKEALRILTDLKDESTLERWFMQNYLIRLLRGADVLRAQDKQLSLNFIFNQLSLELNDYRHLVELFKQHLDVHRTYVTEFKCDLVDGGCTLICEHILPDRIARNIYFTTGRNVYGKMLKWYVRNKIRL